MGVWDADWLADAMSAAQLQRWSDFYRGSPDLGKRIDNLAAAVGYWSHYLGEKMTQIAYSQAGKHYTPARKKISEFMPEWGKVESPENSGLSLTPISDEEMRSKLLILNALMDGEVITPDD